MAVPLSTPVELSYFERVHRDQPFGWRYVKNSSHYPFEEIDHLFWQPFVEAHRNWAFYAGGIYLLVIFGGQWWMRQRPAMELRMPLFFWNAALGIFSILGFWRTLPGFYHVLSQVDNGFYKSICAKEELDVQTTYWVLLFVWSKFIELGDTVFIVLRKRPLIFLQWYHHLVTMSVVWILAPLVEPIVRWYMVLNYGVHSLMYPYFALRALGIRIPSRVANLITTLQLTQMILGFTVNMLSLYYQKTGHTDCVRYPISIQLFSVVYGSFLVLFGKLFYDSVIRRGREKRTGKKID